MSRALQRVAEVEHTSPPRSTAPRPHPAGWPRRAPPRHSAMSFPSATNPPAPRRVAMTLSPRFPW